MRLSIAQENVISSMIHFMSVKKTTNIFVVLNRNSPVKVGNKNEFAQITYLENDSLKFRLKTASELFDPVEIRTLSVLVRKGVLKLDKGLSTNTKFVYRWDFLNGESFPMSENIKQHLIKNGVKF